MKNYFQVSKLIFIDIVIIIFISWFSFFVRFEWSMPSIYYNNLAALIILHILISAPLFYKKGLYHFIKEFVSIRDIYNVLKYETISYLVIATVILIFRDFYLFHGFPRSVLVISYILSLLGFSASRIFKRMYSEVFIKKSNGDSKTLIIGAGEAGEQTARLILASKKTPYDLVGFIDDSPKKQNLTIHGIKVIGTRKDLPEIIKNQQIQSAIIAIPSAKSEIIKETIDILKANGVKDIKTLPPLSEIIDGKFSLSDIREIKIEDILGRSVAEFDQDTLKNFIKDKVVLVTGASGSIGSELCFQIAKFQSKLLIALEQDETGLFRIKNKLHEKFPNINLKPIIANIQDKVKIDNIFSVLKPQIVIHAAAYKNVPMMEEASDEAVKTNIFGTLVLAQAAYDNNVEKFILISTDKAINPVSIMGATKRVAELICRYFNKKGKTKYAIVRFVNILDSRGNVIEIFKEKIKNKEPIIVTHPEMRRYFMVTSEAVLLVLQAGAISKGGEIFILDPGKSIKIYDLAREMVKLSGLDLDKDISIIFGKPRPGEKLFEEIATPKEKPTKYKNIFISKPQDFDDVILVEKLEELKKAITKFDNKSEIIKILKELIPDYNRSE